MLFNTVAFLLFFLIFHQVYWRVPGTARKYWLIFGSLFFYGFWNIPFLFHFIAVILVNYGIVRLLFARPDRRILFFGIALNLINLAFFKYTNSLLSELGRLIPSAIEVRDSLGIMLPLAISFYTFQIIAFLVDSYRRSITNVSFADFCVFAVFFPHLIAGPIMRHSDFLDQINKAEINEDDTFHGLYLLLIGLLKKSLIADEIAKIIDPVWASPTGYDSLTLFAAALGFSAQVYADFSGYTDMARGLARMLGYHIPENFLSPYFASTFSDLWRRWHITLSTWLRDYLYIPLGGSKKGAFRSYINLTIVMALGGLWHGNTYTFFIWGIFQGLYLSIERSLGLSKPPSSIAGKIIGNFIVMLGWLSVASFFRTYDLSKALDYYVALFRNEGSRPEDIFIVFRNYGFLLIIQAAYLFSHKFVWFMEKYRTRIIPVLSILMFYMLAKLESSVEEFIYFQF